MLTGFLRAALLIALMLALTGCIFSRKPLFDIGLGDTEIEAGRFEGKSHSGRFTLEVERHGSLYVYSDGHDTAILSFHAIGDGFYLTAVIPPGRPISYGVLDARSRDKLVFAFLECGDKTPDDLVPSPGLEGHERCNAADPGRLTSIANRYKADMMAGRLEASKLHVFTRTP